jgi:hypothetical protein
MSNKELFRVEGLPIFQNKMFENKKSAINCSRGDVILVQNSASGLIYNAAFDSSLMNYDHDYQNEQACSPLFQLHLNSVRLIIEKNFPTMTFTEVGCGKGYFLDYMRKAGFKVVGLDPTYEGDDPNVIKKYFGDSLNLKPNNIVLRHVLEHVSDPFEFLYKIAETNKFKGYIYIEVPCLDWIAEHKAWFDIFYEHVNYFRLADFESIFENVVDSGHIFHGQYLFVVAKLGSLRKPRLKKSSEFSFPVDFLDGISRVKELIKTQKHKIIWGGASKGLIFSLYLQRAGIFIDYIIDINPAKQGKYLGVSGLKVSSPEEVLNKVEKGSDIFIMNSNYMEEIIKLSNNEFNYIKVD